MKRLFLNAEHKIRSGWWLLVFFALLLALLFPAILATHERPGGVPLSLQAGLIALVTLACLALRKEPPSRVSGKINAAWFNALVKGLATGALLMLLPALFLFLCGVLHWQVNALPARALASGLALCAWTAIAEELLFRGFVFQRLIEGLGKWPAQLIMAGMFLLTHLDNPGMTGSARVLASVNIFLASILFGKSYLDTRSLAFPLGLHAMANWTQGGLMGFGVSGNQRAGLFRPVFHEAPAWLSGASFGLEASVPGLVVLAAVTAWFYRRGLSPRHGRVSGPGGETRQANSRSAS